jgi:hypothetical protein
MVNTNYEYTDDILKGVTNIGDTQHLIYLKKQTQFYSVGEKRTKTLPNQLNKGKWEVKKNE